MAKSKPEKAKAAAEGAWGNVYVQRFVQDEELRANVKEALDNARSAYARLTNGKSASKVVMEDKKFQKDVKNAADSFKEASVALRDGRKRKRSGGGFGKLVLLASSAAVWRSPCPRTCATRCSTSSSARRRSSTTRRRRARRRPRRRRRRRRRSAAARHANRFERGRPCGALGRSAAARTQPRGGRRPRARRPPSPRGRGARAGRSR